MTFSQIKTRFQGWLVKFSEYGIPLALGIVAFFLITGGRIIRPWKINWLMNGDPAQHYLGWQFFRQAPFVQWPIGAIRNFGMDIGSSIVFTDSIPLLAFLFKPFSLLLPDKFQYAGLWILVCFLLQSLFAWKLLRHFTGDKILLLLGSAFFTLAPVAIWRLQGHYALFGHWLILAAIYYYLSDKFSIVRWTVLLILAALIHAYLLVMAGLILVAHLVQRNWRKEVSAKKSLAYSLAAGSCATFVMWAAGYFMLSSGIIDAQAGNYHMNLLSIIDTNGWSKLLLDQPQGAGDYYEAFNYLGIGVLALGIIAAYEYFRNPQIRCDYRRIVPLAVISAIFSFYAISNHVTIGGIELFHYELPNIAGAVIGAFRSISRFFWPVYYIIYLVILGFIFSRNSGNRVRILVGVFLIVQIIDSADVYRGMRGLLSFAPPWASPMHSEIWGEIGHHYSKLILVPPSNNPGNWIAVSSFAAENRMAVNSGYFARIDPARQRTSAQKLANSISRGRFDADSLYIFNDENLWNVAKANVPDEDFIGVLDGFNVYAPGARRFLK